MSRTSDLWSVKEQSNSTLKRNKVGEGPKEQSNSTWLGAPAEAVQGVHAAHAVHAHDSALCGAGGEQAAVTVPYHELLCGWVGVCGCVCL